MMWIHFLSALLFLTLAQCANGSVFEKKTFDVGETVTLRCPRDYRTGTVTYWIRLLPGKFPESFGATPCCNQTISKTAPSSIETKQEPGSFVLSFTEVHLRDTGFYYCVKVHDVNKSLMFVRATFLKIKDPGLSVESPDVSGTVDSGDALDLQCWVQTENAQCLEEHMVLWVRSGLDQSSPGLVYAQGNISGQCGRSAGDHGPHKCLYTFSETMSRPDAGTYRCAVAACGQILFGNKTTVTVKDKAESKCVVERAVIILLSVLLTISLIVLSVLIYSIQRKCGRCFFENPSESNTNITEHTSPQRDAELTYAAPKFNKRKAKKSQCRTDNEEEPVVYSDVRSRI